VVARLTLVTVAMVAWPAALWSSQPPTVATAAGVVHVHAPAFHFLDGEAITRLRDGQVVRLELQLAILSGPGAAASAEHRRTFVLSYDLWEERFAVALPGAPRRAVSHLTAAAAEAWCVQQLQVPVTAMGTLGRDVPFWIRLDARLIDGSADTPDDQGLTLQRLIELLSRRRRTDDVSHTVEAGPFRIKE
jgi:hypothetical protein